MQIFIPSMQRAGNQLTLNALPPSLRIKAVVVVPKGELATYAKVPGINVVACPVDGIGPTRHWILTKKATEDKVVMLDDDLRFFVRRDDDPSKFLQATPKQIEALFKTLERTLTPAVPHVGVCTREGGNRILEDLMCTRLLRMLAYHVPTYKALKVKFDRIQFMEDFDVTLQLLRAGKPNRLLHAWCHDQVTSNAPGGCSTYRTLAKQGVAAHSLKKLHPEFVRVVEKTTKTAWGGATRTDVQIAWKKAYKSSGVPF